MQIDFNALPEHLQRRIVINQDSGCWLWQGVIQHGYGKCYSSKKHQGCRIHRYIWELFFSPVNELHHVCRNKRCCNPLHLQPLDRATHRKIHFLDHSKLQNTHCPQGHPYSGENLGIYNNWRYCKTCRRERQRKQDKTAYNKRRQKWRQKRKTLGFPRD